MHIVDSAKRLVKYSWLLQVLVERDLKTVSYTHLDVYKRQRLKEILAVTPQMQLKEGIQKTYHDYVKMCIRDSRQV